mgnify:CR=1 FL=1
MEIDKLTKQLHLLELLVDGEPRTKERLCEELGLSRRTLYRYMELFREAGFHVSMTKQAFTVKPSSPFIQKLTAHVRLTTSEQVTIHNLLEKLDDSDMAVRNLKAKFRDTYGMKFVGDTPADRNVAQNTELLLRAIAQKRQVCIRGYLSPHSQTLSDRVVEPFKFLQGSREIRCYEPASGMCKSFKLVRMKERIEVLPQAWQYEREHRTYYTDMFGFSGETTYRIKLRLGYLSAHLLMEEYGVQAYQLVILDEKHWLFSTRVCSMQGIGRFVMGLCNDIEILEGTELKQYISGVLQKLTKSVKNE